MDVDVWAPSEGVSCLEITVRKAEKGSTYHTNNKG